jgi:hypothetical protein
MSRRLQRQADDGAAALYKPTGAVPVPGQFNLQSSLWAVLRLDRTAMAYAATRSESRGVALLLVLLVSVLQPAEIRVLDDVELLRGEQRSVLHSCATAAVHALLSLVFCFVTGVVFRQLDKMVTTGQIFNLLGLCNVWVLLLWPLSVWDRSLSIGPLSNLLVFIALVLGLSELAGVRVFGAFLTLLLSGLASICCLMVTVTTVAVALMGVFAGVLGAVLNDGDVERFLQRFGVNVEVDST